MMEDENEKIRKTCIMHLTIDNDTIEYLVLKT